MLNQKPVEKWIVISTYLPPTNKFKILSKNVDFQPLVVGDKKTNKLWHKNNEIFLSIEIQKQSGLKSHSSIPFNSYARKNIGYLYAIKNGAKFIFDTDNDKSANVDLESNFVYDENDKGLINDDPASKRMVNPYAHFGQPFIYPRGFPLDEIQKSFDNSYVSGPRKVSVVQQGIFNGDSAIDAMFPFSKKLNNQQINIKFDESAPPFQVPLYKMAPYTSKNTLISYAGFWSLYLPHSVSSQLVDIWRSYWAQRLMWLLNQTVSFSYANAYKSSYTNLYLKDSEGDNYIHLVTKSFVDFLFEWKCLYNFFYECMIQLTVNMAEEGFWDKSEINSIKNWIFDLQSVGYQEPKIINSENRGTNDNFGTNYLFGDFGYTRIRYSPEFYTPNELVAHLKNSSSLLPDNVEPFQFFKTMCKKYGITLEDAKKNVSRKEKFSVLVTFNHEPIVENILILSKLYQHKFQNLIFCGYKLIEKLKIYKDKIRKLDSFTFIEIENSLGGIYHYFCLNKAIEMGYKTEGFLLMSDDVFLKYWNLRSFNMNNVWFPFDLTLFLNPNKPLKEWGHSIKGFRNLLKTWDEMEEISKSRSVSEHEVNIIKNYFNQIDNNQDSKSDLKHIRKIKISGADIFYVPKRKFSDFYFLSKMFRKHNTFLEIAVPNILAGIESNNSIQIMNGHYDWVGVPLNFDRYEKYQVFYHPFKLSKLKYDQIGSNYCKYYLSDVFEFENFSKYLKKN
ncbi:transmembrane (DUF288) [Brachionus plicatilis]|uniref:Transmembrane (DUF288) n=1 Tax=Brachionus plicatilis TaxID=10195 RepID=A0A3M7SP87_BRAPC|nr:transmembrane (DUF288) [Brachionus plicatilis]